MFLLFKLLKALKQPTLSKAEWGQLADIYNGLEDKTVVSFNQAYLAQQPGNKDTIQFIQHWFSIREELIALDSLMGNNLAQSDRVLILASLLPDDLTQLHMAVTKIEWLSAIGLKHNITNDLLRHFLHAISYRIQQHENKLTTTLTCSISQQELQDIIEIIYKDILRKKLKYLCTQYTNSIISSIDLYLQNDKFCLLYYSVGGKKIDMHSLIKSELEAIHFHSEHANLTPLLRLLFQKYERLEQLMKLLDGTIKYPEGDTLRIVHNASNDERLLAFAQSFTDYVDVFKMRVYDSTYTLFAQTSYTDESLEDEFIRHCQTITDQINLYSTKHAATY